jgi:hypothetical protein
MEFIKEAFLDPAIKGAEKLLDDKDCQSLFDTLSMDFNLGNTSPAQILQTAYDLNQVRLFDFGDNIKPGGHGSDNRPEWFDPNCRKSRLRHRHPREWRSSH